MLGIFVERHELFFFDGLAFLLRSWDLVAFQGVEGGLAEAPELSALQPNLLLDRLADVEVRRACQFVLVELFIFDHIVVIASRHLGRVANVVVRLIAEALVVEEVRRRGLRRFLGQHVAVLIELAIAIVLQVALVASPYTLVKILYTLVYFLFTLRDLAVLVHVMTEIVAHGDIASLSEVWIRHLWLLQAVVVHHLGLVHHLGR